MLDMKKMEYNIYQSLQEFINYFEDDYYLEYVEINPNLTFIEYLTDILKLYSALVQEGNKMWNVYAKDLKANKITKEIYDDLTTNNRRISHQFFEISRFIERKISRKKVDFEETTATVTKIKNEILSEINPKAKNKKWSNPKKLAFIEVLLRNPVAFQNLSEDKQNEIIAKFLDADKTEFVYKNRINIKSKAPSYQIDKYTAYQYIEEMESFLNDMK